MPSTSTAGAGAHVRVGRYLLGEPIASGGMATVHVGRLIGDGGFVKMVAIKRLHEGFAQDPSFLTMLKDEAQIASRMNHPNIGAVLDVIVEQRNVLIVMEYLHGESLAHLIDIAQTRGIKLPIEVVVGIITGALAGLHAAHEVTDDNGHPLRVVHRDVSPQNIIVGADGVTKLVDFGIAYAASRHQRTESGVVKGKPQYMAPEQVLGQSVDRRTDVFAVGVMLWEMLCGGRLFAADSIPATMMHVLEKPVPAPSTLVGSSLPKALDDIVLKSLARDPAQRFATAMEMMEALETALQPATARAIGAFVESLVGERLAERKQALLEMRKEATPSTPATPATPATLDSEDAHDDTVVAHDMEKMVSTPPPARTVLVASAQAQLASNPNSSLSSAPPARAEVARTNPTTGKRRGFLLGGFFVVFGLALCAIVVAAVHLASPEPRDPTRLSSSSTTSSSSASPVALSSPPPSPSIIVLNTNGSAAEEPSSGVPSSSTTTTNAHRGHTSPSRSLGSTHRSTPPSTPASGSTPSCDPPFRLDSSGVRVPKQECL